MWTKLAEYTHLVRFKRRNESMWIDETGMEEEDLDSDECNNKVKKMPGHSLSTYEEVEETFESMKGYWIYLTVIFDVVDLSEQIQFNLNLPWTRFFGSKMEQFIGSSLCEHEKKRILR